MPSSFHMSPDEFRRLGRIVVDWLADYYEHIEEYPVLSQVSPGELRSMLPPSAPEHGEPFEHVMRDVERLIVPGLTHWQAPGFFGYFPANSSGPSVLGELLSAGFGVQGMKWSTSPSCTELEMHVMDWLVDMLGLPGFFRSDGGGGGVIQDTASSATLCAMLAARERKTKGLSNTEGVRQPLVAYASSQAHMSVEKAAGIAGIGRHHLRPVDTDAGHRLSVRALRDAVSADVKGGFEPFFVCATVGTTGVGAVDPVAQIAEVAAEFDLWLHVDAAMAGTAAICPEFRIMHDGMEHADSYCFNPHKWMFTNFDCDCFFVNDRSALEQALSLTPEYLRDTVIEADRVIDYRNWQISLGRRFRALKLWFTIRHYGIEGIRHHVREHIRLAEMLESHIRSHADFDLMTDRSLNLVCFRHRNGDRFTQSVMEAVNESGRAFLTHTLIDGRFAIRMCVGQTRTAQRHVDAAWNLICETAASLSATAGNTQSEAPEYKGTAERDRS